MLINRLIILFLLAADLSLLQIAVSTLIIIIFTAAAWFISLSVEPRIKRRKAASKFQPKVPLWAAILLWNAGVLAAIFIYYNYDRVTGLIASGIIVLTGIYGAVIGKGEPQ